MLYYTKMLCELGRHLHARANKRTHIHTHTRTHIHTHRRTYAHTRTHTHTHTQLLSPSRPTAFTFGELTFNGSFLNSGEVGVDQSMFGFAYIQSAVSFSRESKGVCVAPISRMGGVGVGSVPLFWVWTSLDCCDFKSKVTPLPSSPPSS
jgi:hypothetical protein